MGKRKGGASSESSSDDMPVRGLRCAPPCRRSRGFTADLFGKGVRGHGEKKPILLAQQWMKGKRRPEGRTAEGRKWGAVAGRERRRRCEGLDAGRRMRHWAVAVRLRCLHKRKNALSCASSYYSLNSPAGCSAGLDVWMPPPPPPPFPGCKRGAHYATEQTELYFELFGVAVELRVRSIASIMRFTASGGLVFDSFLSSVLVSTFPSLSMLLISAPSRSLNTGALPLMKPATIASFQRQRRRDLCPMSRTRSDSHMTCTCPPPRMTCVCHVSPGL